MPPASLLQRQWVATVEGPNCRTSAGSTREEGGLAAACGHRLAWPPSCTRAAAHATTRLVHGTRRGDELGERLEPRGETITHLLLPPCCSVRVEGLRLPRALLMSSEEGSWVSSPVLFSRTLRSTTPTGRRSDRPTGGRVLPTTDRLLGGMRPAGQDHQPSIRYVSPRAP